MMPFRVAMALQADGWYLRSVIPWLKRSAMPESVTDRPASAVEYVFLLAKSSRYFWDADAVRATPYQGDDGWRFYANRGMVDPREGRPRHTGSGQPRDGGNSALAAGQARDFSAGRNRRNSDWFFESWQGLMLDEADDPLALIVNPAPFKSAHFATFGPKLVEPMIKASTRLGDVILDPFFGAGTVGLVADRLGRSAIGCELKPDYADMGADRITDDAPLFSSVLREELTA